LRKSDYKLAILTDVVHPKRILVRFFDRLSLTNNVDAIFFSNVIGYAKPHKKSYMLAMKHFRVSPSQTVFVGHSKDEILGAGKLGIKTVKLGSEKVRSDYKIKSLPQLLAIMKKLEK
jgi:putative hydrolase of the HAD superfamily